MKKRKVATWNNCTKENDYLWAECSCCKFRIEAYKAVIRGKSSSDYIGVNNNYQYCPRCGSYMQVK